ncbi:restriction endonuclease subunit S [Muribaculum sp. NM65_B17]|uniref:restriction endonuclease subunit S n=1 Tax=Muribaculum sp. NM65_B17 TaxID=2516961 RepID=UPI0010938B4C|nr:restriction endonuclease subunit S [Muribaculum sp. NM65_B17]TGY03618.1 restriction endonuclease subunit S [Muribaculum sp. NM65_B17]
MSDVPHLRFPEFTEEWVNVSLKDVADFQKERISSGLLDESTYISTENILQNFQGVQSAISIPANTNVIAYKKNDILLSNIRPYLKKVWFSDRIGGCSADVFVLRSKTCEPEFLYNVIASDKFINYVMSGAKGVKMPRGDKNQMGSFSFSIPAVAEQRKISRLFQLLDERIATQNKIIEKLQSLISGIIQNAIQKGLNDNTWEMIYLSKLLTERKEKNRNGYEVSSVSVSEGVINQIEYLGRSFAASDTSKYNVVRYGDIVYTKSPTGNFPYGIIKQSFQKHPVAVSPLYGVYEPYSNEAGCFLHYYFLSSIVTTNYLSPLIQKGAKNTINISNQTFLNNIVPYPKEEVGIIPIAALLRNVQIKLNIERLSLVLLEQQKIYLLRGMFI